MHTYKHMHVVELTEKINKEHLCAYRPATSIILTSPTYLKGPTQ